MRGMKDIIVLGGVVVAGYLLLQGGDDGGSGIQYIRNIPRSISPGVKETPPAPTIIQFPSETVNFPAPKLPSVTSLLPQMPTTQPVTKTQPVASTPKKVAKTTTTTKKKELNVPSMWNPQTSFYEQIGGITGGKSSIVKTSSKKTTLPKDWEKGSPYWEQALKEPERFSEKSVWDIAKKIETQKKTTTTTTTTKKSSSLKSVGYRSRAAFVRSFGWK